MDEHDEDNCTCGTPGINYEGPERDCPVHGDVHPDVPTEGAELANLVNTLADEFDALCYERHKLGQEEYGAFTFLGNDVTRMMLEELADTSNYCRMQAVKLLMLQDLLDKQLTEKGLVKEGEEQITIGIQAFTGTKDIGWGDKS